MLGFLCCTNYLRKNLKLTLRNGSREEHAYLMKHSVTIILKYIVHIYNLFILDTRSG